MSSFEMTAIEVQTPFGTTATSHLFQAAPANPRLMIVLPGRGYIHDHPVLFHLRYMALENGFDVLAVSYGLDTSGPANPEHYFQLPAVVNRATAQAMTRGYRQVCVLGKSLGTPLAVELAAGLQAEKIAVILLTPIGSALQDQNIARFPTLALIGTGDPYFAPDLTAQTPPNVHWQIFDALDHGLMVEDDWQASTRALHDIIQTCESFLKEQYS